MPLEATVAAPVLPAAAFVCSAEAAATWEGLVSSTDRPAVAAAVGRTMKLSPLLAVPLTTIERPAAVKGLAAVPAPDSATLCPVSASVSCHEPPLNFMM